MFISFCDCASVEFNSLTLKEKNVLYYIVRTAEFTRNLKCNFDMNAIKNLEEKCFILTTEDMESQNCILIRPINIYAFEDDPHFPESRDHSSKYIFCFQKCLHA